LNNIASRNGISLEELQATLEAGGIRFADFREDTRMQILTGRLQSQEVASGIQVTDQEIDRFLKKGAGQLVPREQVRLSHILVALPDNPSPAQVAQAEAKARSVVAKLRGGADFAAVAAASSDGRSALQGGDLGWFEMAAVPTLVAELAKTMAQGEVTDPLRSPSGFNIIKLTDIKGGLPGNVTQTHARHILIRTSEIVSDDDAKVRLGSAASEDRRGRRFRHPGARAFGRYGLRAQGRRPGLDKPRGHGAGARRGHGKLAPNEVSEPFKSPFGWHLVQVLERRSQDTTQELLRLKAKEAIQRRKAEEATETWLKRLRDEAYVEVRLDTPTPGR
jgi:peptidyl-prolyl cis-trans isomerase SurA